MSVLAGQLLDLGWITRQDFDTERPHGTRYMTHSVRAERDESSGEAKLGIAEDDQGRRVIGDDLSWAWWAPADRRIGSFSPSLAAIISEAPTAPPVPFCGKQKGKRKKPRTKVRRKTSGDYKILPQKAVDTPDPGYVTKAPELPHSLASKFPKGWTGTWHAAADADDQVELFRPDFLGLVAVNHGGDPKMSTRVFDTGDDSALHPERWRELNSIFSVVEFEKGCLSGKAIALNLGKGGRLDGGLGHLPMVDWNDCTVGSASARFGGPLTLDHDGGCQHRGKMGGDVDGNQTTPVHLSANPANNGTLFKWGGLDAPLAFTPQIAIPNKAALPTPASPPGPFTMDAWIRYNPEASHGTCGGSYFGQWVIQTTSWLQELPPPYDDETGDPGDPDDEIDEGGGKPHGHDGNGGVPKVCNDGSYVPSYPSTQQYLATPGHIFKATATSPGELNPTGSSVPMHWGPENTGTDGSDSLPSDSSLPLDQRIRNSIERAKAEANNAPDSAVDESTYNPGVILDRNEQQLRNKHYREAPQVAALTSYARGDGTYGGFESHPDCYGGYPVADGGVVFSPAGIKYTDLINDYAAVEAKAMTTARLVIPSGISSLDFGKPSLNGSVESGGHRLSHTGAQLQINPVNADGSTAFGEYFLMGPSGIGMVDSAISLTATGGGDVTIASVSGTIHLDADLIQTSTGARLDPGSVELQDRNGLASVIPGSAAWGFDFDSTVNSARPLWTRNGTRGPLALFSDLPSGGIGLDSSFNLDLNSLTEQASPGSGDFFVIYDAGLGAHRKVDYDNMPGGTSPVNALLDGSNHSDTVAGTVVRGDLIVGNSTPAWERKARGSTGAVLYTDASGDLQWTGVTTTDGEVLVWSVASQRPVWSSAIFTPLDINTDLRIRSDHTISWSNSNANTTTRDVGLERSASGVLQVTDASTGLGSLDAQALTLADASDLAGTGLADESGALALSFASVTEQASPGSGDLFLMWDAGEGAARVVDYDNLPAGGGGGSTFADDVFRVQDNSDATKQIAFEASTISTGTTRTFTWPDASGTVWTSGNDGTGSGLDADTVDGIEGAALLLADLSNATADLAIADGGTGAGTASAAFDNLSPMTTLGDVVYGGASGTGTRLPGNTTTAKQFLSQTGDGANSAAPAWAALVAGDIPDLSGTYQPLDTQLTAIAGLSDADSVFIVGSGAGFVAESGATARTSMGVGTGDSPTFAGLALTSAAGIAGAGLENASGALRIAAAAAGAGLTGGAGSALAVDVDSLAEQASPGSGDFVLIHDTGLGALRKVDLDNLPAGPTSFADDVFAITDNADATKVAAFQCSTISTSTTRTYTLPDESGTVMLTSAIGSTVQAYDADLAAIAGLTSAADKLPYFDGSESAALADFTAFARTILDDANAAAVQATLGVVPGTDVLDYDFSGYTQQGSPGSGDLFLMWDAGVAAPRLVDWDDLPSGGGSSDHGSQTGLGDDDHSQYLRTDGARDCTGEMTFYVNTATAEVKNVLQITGRNSSGNGGNGMGSSVELKAEDSGGTDVVGCEISHVLSNNGASSAVLIKNRDSSALAGGIYLNTHPTHGDTLGTNGRFQCESFWSGQDVECLMLDNDYLELNDAQGIAGAGLEDDGAGLLRVAASAAGDGLTGGAGSALAVDINGQTEQASPGSGDFVLIHDTGLTALRKVDLDNLPYLATSAIGSTVQAYSANLDTYAANPLTSGELGELQNIGATTISAAQWGYLGAAGGTLWTSANDGAGSGLDADLLDGNEASAFAAAAHNHDASYQPLDADLTALAGLTSAADRLPYFTGSGTMSLATFTTAARNLLDDSDVSAMRTTLGLAIGSDVQAYDADLASLSDPGAITEQGSPGSGDLFLMFDAGASALRVVDYDNLPGGSGGGGGYGLDRLSANVTEAGSVSATGETDLMSYTIPSGTLAADGDQVMIYAAGYWASNTGFSCELAFYVDGTKVRNSSYIPSADIPWTYHVTITRLSSTSVLIAGQPIGHGHIAGELTSAKTETVSDLASNTLAIKFTGDGTGGSTDDVVVQQVMTVDYYPAP